MWELTIYQIKKYDTFETEQTITYKNKDIHVLLNVVSILSTVKTYTKTWYEIKKGEDEKCASENLEQMK